MHPHTARARAVSGTNGIAYHGGTVLLGTPDVHLIWYGTWNGSGAHGSDRLSDSIGTQNLLEHLIQSLNGSRYERINSTYTDGRGHAISGQVRLAGASYDAYSRGAKLTDDDVAAIVAAHSSGSRQAAYIILTSSDVQETSGFGSLYCGWHSHEQLNGVDTYFAFIGNPTRYAMACEAQSYSPNANPAGDAMANIIAHELEEMISDPEGTAWFDDDGEENADKCAWQFGDVRSAWNGSAYNQTLHGVQYLIQQNWMNASGGYCASHK